MCDWWAAVNIHIHRGVLTYYAQASITPGTTYEHAEKPNDISRMQSSCWVNYYRPVSMTRLPLQ